MIQYKSAGLSMHPPVWMWQFNFFSYFAVSDSWVHPIGTAQTICFDKSFDFDWYWKTSGAKAIVGEINIFEMKSIFSVIYTVSYCRWVQHSFLLMIAESFSWLWQVTVQLMMKSPSIFEKKTLLVLFGFDMKSSGRYQPRQVLLNAYCWGFMFGLALLCLYSILGGRGLS